MPNRSSEGTAAATGAAPQVTRLFSAYTLASGQRLWVITEWDRSYTTLLLSSEY